MSDNCIESFSDSIFKIDDDDDDDRFCHACDVAKSKIFTYEMIITNVSRDDETKNKNRYMDGQIGRQVKVFFFFFFKNK